MTGRELTTLEIRNALVPCLESLLEEHGDILVDVVENFPNAPGTEERAAPTHPVTTAFAYYNLDKKIKPIVEFLLELGVSRSDIPTIIYKRPQLCGISLSESLKPTMTYLENFGVDQSKWAKVIHRFPALLTYSRQKLKGTVDYLTELGVSEENIGKILTRCPHITSYSVDVKLRPTVR